MAAGSRIYDEHFFASNKFVQSILCIHPDHSQNDALFSLCLITFYLSPGLLHQFYQLFTSEVTMQSAVEVLPKTIGIIILLTAYSTIYFGFVTMKLLLHRINMVYEVLLNNEELHLFEESIKQSKLYVYVVLGLFNGYGFSLVVPCIVIVCLYFYGILDDNNLPLIFPVDNVTKAGVKYFCSLIYQIILVIIVIIIGGVSFSGYMIFVLFACFQFRVLILKIKRPFKRNLKYFQKNCCFITPQEEYDWIIDIINRFKNVTEYVDLLNNFSSITYLVATVLALSMIAFDFLFIFQLSASLNNLTQIVELSFYIAGSLFTIYINFFFGQELMNYSNLVYKELCQVPFYNLSHKTQKFLLFVIAKSCKASTISIGGMFVSTHATFAALIQKAFSFAMVYYSTL